MVRVLCVEDDPLVRAFLEQRLRLEGDIEIGAMAASAEAACEYLRRETFDVVVLDYHLGGMNGMQLLHSITLWLGEELSGGRPRPRVLFCTAHASPEFEAEARAMGARGVVAKDRAVMDLVPAIRTVVRDETWFQFTPARPDDTPARKVLVAETSRPLRALLSRTLEQAGYDVTLAWSGDDILGLLGRESFDLLLLDHRLPGHPSGTMVLEAIAERWQRLPVLLLGTLPAWMDDYRPTKNVQGIVSTPIQLQQLQDEVRRALDWEPAGSARSFDPLPGVESCAGASPVGASARF